MKESEWYFKDEFGLPKKFDTKEVKELRSEDCGKCMLCEKVFDEFEHHHCMRCARSVCEQCSNERRKLCTKNNNYYRTCDLCITAMENVELQGACVLQYQLKRAEV